MTNGINTIRDYSTKEDIEIMDREEIEAIINKWLEDGNAFSDLLREEGIWQYGSTFGMKAVVEIDTRDGKIGTRTEIPNEWSMDQAFFIDLSSHPLIDREETITELWDEGDMGMKALTVDQMTELIFDSEEETLEFIESESLEPKLEAFYSVLYRDVYSYNGLSVEDWVTKVCKESYEELESDTLDYIFENRFEESDLDWEKEVKKFYECHDEDPEYGDEYLA